MESRVWIFFMFVLYLGIGYGTAIVSIIGENGTVSFDSSSLQFGPDFTWRGYIFEGYLEYVTPHSACKMITKKHESSEVALIALSTSKENCTIGTKVLNAQRAGFQAAIVFNTKDNGLVEMMVSKHGGNDIAIASVFVGLSAGVELQAATFETGATVRIEIVIEWWFYLIYVLYLGIFSIILISVFRGVRRCVDARRRRRSRMSRTNCKRIPTKKFPKGSKAANEEAECDHMGDCAFAHDQPGEKKALCVVKVEVPRKKKKGKKSKKTKTDEGEGKANGGFGMVLAPPGTTPTAQHY